MREFSVQFDGKLICSSFWCSLTICKHVSVLSCFQNSWLLHASCKQIAFNLFLNPLQESYEVQSVVYSEFHLFEFKVFLKHNGDNNLIVMSFISQIVSSGTIHIKLVSSIVNFGVARDYTRVCWTSTFVSQNPWIKRHTEYINARREIKAV
jgi:hypothetical protein